MKKPPPPARDLDPERPAPPIDKEDLDAGMTHALPRNHYLHPALRLVRTGAFSPYWAPTKVRPRTRDALIHWQLVEFKPIASSDRIVLARLTPKGIHVRDKAMRKAVRTKFNKPRIRKPKPKVTP